MPGLLQFSLQSAMNDPRARRAASAAAAAGFEMRSVSLGGVQRLSGSRRMPRELRGVLRLARLGITTLSILRAVMRETRGYTPDVVHAHDLDTLLAAWITSRRRGARLVYDAHELYAGFDSNPPRLWLAVSRHLEGKLARSAAGVVTVSDEIADSLANTYRLHQRPYVVLNAPRVEYVDLRPHDGPLRAIYQAAAGPGRSLDDVPEVRGVEIHSRVLGGGLATPAHVTDHPPVAPEDLVQALAEFDVGLVIDRLDTENARLALPNKLFEYLMAGLAVLVPRAPAMAGLVEREGVGRVYEPGRLGEALAELAADRPAVEAMRRRAREVAVERYNAEAQRPMLYAAWGV
jgi:glycogen synthase